MSHFLSFSGYDLFRLLSFPNEMFISRSSYLRVRPKCHCRWPPARSCSQTLSHSITFCLAMWAELKTGFHWIKRRIIIVHMIESIAEGTHHPFQITTRILCGDKRTSALGLQGPRHIHHRFGSQIVSVTRLYWSAGARWPGTQTSKVHGRVRVVRTHNWLGLCDLHPTHVCAVRQDQFSNLNINKTPI